MIFEFELTHEVEGSVIISEPIGWKNASVGLERHPKFRSLIEFYKSDFKLYGSDYVLNGGRDWVKNVESLHGLDALVSLRLRYSDNDEPFKIFFLGQVPIVKIIEELDLAHIITIMFSPIDFWTKFVSRFELPVDVQSALSVDGEEVDVISPINFPLPSQQLTKTTSYVGEIVNASPTDYKYDLPDGMAIDHSGVEENIDVFSGGVLDLEQQEIDESIVVGFGFQTLAADVVNVIDMKSESGPMEVTANEQEIALSLAGQLSMVSTEPDHSSIFNVVIQATMYVKKNNEAPIVIGFDTDTQPGPANPSAPGFPRVFQLDFNFSISGSETIDVVVGDIVTVYIEYAMSFNITVGADTGGILWDYRNIFVTDMTSDISFVIQSLFKNTTQPAFLIHDVGMAIVDRIVNGDKSFYSEYLGNPQCARVYAERGCASDNVLIKGTQLRGYTLSERAYSPSMKEWYEGVQPMFNIGIGYDRRVVDGVLKDIIEVEEIDKFYDASATSVDFYNVRKIKRYYAEDEIFNLIVNGYAKGESETAMGLDDTQLEQQRSVIFKNVSKRLDIISKYIAASVAVEATRRSVKEKSADYKFDNDTFVIAALYEAGAFRPELGSDFTAVTNLLNADTRYNIRHSCAHVFERWKRYLSGMLFQYPAATFDFRSGKGNYTMTSQLPENACEDTFGGNVLAENANLPVSSDFIFIPMPYQIEHVMSIQEYEAILANKKMAIGISQTNANPKKFFIDKLDYKLVQGTFSAILLPKEPFNIEVVETASTPPGGIFDDSFDETFE